MLLSTLLEERDSGLISGTIFSPYSKRNPIEDCKLRGFSTSDGSKHCKGQIETKFYSNTNDLATFVNKQIFKLDSVNKVNIFL